MLLSIKDKEIFFTLFTIFFFFFISKHEKIMKGSLSSFGILIEKIYLAVKGEIYLTTKERKRGRGKQRNLCPTKFS